MKRTLTILFLSIILPLAARAQSSLIEASQRAISSDPENKEMNDELSMPMVGPKLQPYITSYMMEVARNLHRDKFNVETMRRGEVVIVTIPTDNLFPPNETELFPSAGVSLSPFKKFITPDNRFKLILAVHSDDTGSEEYLFDLTEARINSILDYFEAEGLSTDQIIGFPKGDTEPVVSNMSRADRATNRRLEIYIVPDQGLINEARQQKK